MPNAITIIIFAIIAVVVAVISFLAGMSFRRKKSEAVIGSAEDEAKRILNEAMKTAEANKKEAVLEAKDEIYTLKAETDRELKERRSEVQRQERRLQQKEESLDKKIDNIEAKEEKISARAKDLEQKIAEADQIKKSQLDMLEKISGLTVDQAKAQIISALDDELCHEKAVKIREYEQQFKEEVDSKSRELISQAIQRCAADHSSETTVSVVPLPNDEMKGRIIGREGRNIRAIETATGVDLIIDDTPEAITVSSFDPIRREIARLALERLITDGRIHPTKIEEAVAKAKSEVDRTIKREGERAYA